jgi:hypothetical protein
MSERIKVKEYFEKNDIIKESDLIKFISNFKTNNLAQVKEYIKNELKKFRKTSSASRKNPFGADIYVRIINEEIQEKYTPRYKISSFYNITLGVLSDRLKIQPTKLIEIISEYGIEIENTQQILDQVIIDKMEIFIEERLLNLHKLAKTQKQLEAKKLITIINRNVKVKKKKVVKKITNTGKKINHSETVYDKLKASGRVGKIIRNGMRG